MLVLIWFCVLVTLAATLAWKAGVKDDLEWLSCSVFSMAGAFAVTWEHSGSRLLAWLHAMIPDPDTGLHDITVLLLWGASALIAVAIIPAYAFWCAERRNDAALESPRPEAPHGRAHEASAATP